MLELLDVTNDQAYCCMTFKHWKGGDMIGGLNRALDASGRPSEATAARLATQLFASVAHCHDAGVLHRDIKADNVLIDRKDIADPECQICLCDFGMAIMHGDGSVPRTDAVGKRPLKKVEMLQASDILLT